MKTNKKYKQSSWDMLLWLRRRTVFPSLLKVKHVFQIVSLNIHHQMNLWTKICFFLLVGIYTWLFFQDSPLYRSNGERSLLRVNWRARPELPVFCGEKLCQPFLGRTLLVVSCFFLFWLSVFSVLSVWENGLSLSVWERCAIWSYQAPVVRNLATLSKNENTACCCCLSFFSVVSGLVLNCCFLFC